jgi:hypothetical protein
MIRETDKLRHFSEWEACLASSRVQPLAETQPNRFYCSSVQRNAKENAKKATSDLEIGQKTQEVQKFVDQLETDNRGDYLREKEQRNELLLKVAQALGALKTAKGRTEQLQKTQKVVETEGGKISEVLQNVFNQKETITDLAAEALRKAKKAGEDNLAFKHSLGHVQGKNESVRDKNLGANKILNALLQKYKDRLAVVDGLRTQKAEVVAVQGENRKVLAEFAQRDYHLESGVHSVVLELGLVARKTKSVEIKVKRAAMDLQSWRQEQVTWHNKLSQRQRKLEETRAKLMHKQEKLAVDMSGVVKTNEVFVSQAAVIEAKQGELLKKMEAVVVSRGHHQTATVFAASLRQKAERQVLFDVSIQKSLADLSDILDQISKMAQEGSVSP